jgi:hypothetical protein
VALGGLPTLTNAGTSYDGPRRGVLRSSS